MTVSSKFRSVSKSLQKRRCRFGGNVLVLVWPNYDFDNIEKSFGLEEFDVEIWAQSFVCCPEFGVGISPTRGRNRNNTPLIFLMKCMVFVSGNFYGQS